MPLLPGKKNIGSNIRTLESEGYEYPQARAIALKKAKVPMARSAFAKAARKELSRHKRKKKRGGHVPLHILEKRLIKLSRVVASRRGRTTTRRRRRKARKK